MDECTYYEQSENDKPKESEASTEAPTQEQTTQKTNANQTGSLHTYKTRMAEYFPEQTTFYFDYPDNWTILTVEVGNYGTQYTSAAMSRISKSRYNPGKDFWIIKIKNTSNFDSLHDQTITFDDGAEMYAVTTAEKSIGETFDYRSGGCVMAFMFECPNSAGFRSEPSDKLTDKDREEIIAILESFRDTP